LDPDIVIIGGGFGIRIWDLIKDDVRKSATEELIGEFISFIKGKSQRGDIKIVKAKLGEDSGLYGAGKLVLDNIGRKR
jgi:predicted NBD/HSP70 family sugar kinase